jgi:hypothetical protein
LDNAEDEKLETDGFGPSDITIVGFPAWDETPRTPPAIDPNCDSHA